MSNLTDKVEAVQRLAAGYRAVLELADELGDIASLDARKNELEAQVKASQSVLADLAEKARLAREEAASVQSGSLAEAASAQQHADRVRADAEAKAGKAIENADERAAGIELDARIAADKTIAAARSAADQVRAAAQKAKDELETEATVAAGRLAEMQGDIVKAGAQLEELNAKIDQARSVIDNFKR